MNSRIPDINVNSFEYKRTAYKITAYGKEYELPVRTTAFCDKQDEIDMEIADTSVRRTSAEILAALRRGIDLFIGDGEAEKLFPSEGEENIDVDEITSFYTFLKTASIANLKAHTEKYRSVSAIRRR